MKNRINVSEITGEGLSLKSFLESQSKDDSFVITMNDNIRALEQRCYIAS